VKLGPLIGRGRRCSVYAWGEGQILKLFEPGAPQEWIDSEAIRARLIRDAGLPAPWVGDVLEVGDRKGIVYERLEGPSLENAVREDLSQAPDLLRRLAELHYSLHCAKVDGLPSQRPGIRRAIERTPLLTSEVRARVLAVLDSLPDGTALCHGDLNLNNVILTPDGWKVIDWDNASLGNPLADVARSVLMLDAGLNYCRSPEERAIIERVEPLARDAYVRRYLELSGLSADELKAWRVPLAAARLSEGIDEEESWLLEIAGSVLQD